MTMRTWEMFEAEQNATDYGKAFIAAGFALNMTGGGCTAWEKELANGLRLSITDSEGVDCKLSDANANDPDKPDEWMIGLYTSEYCSGFYMNAATAGDALASCLALVFRFIVKRDLAEHLRAIDRVNAYREMKGDNATCATHDHCDANMLMLEAWQMFCATPMRPHIDADLAVWNQAWQIARSRPFGES